MINAALLLFFLASPLFLVNSGCTAGHTVHTRASSPSLVATFVAGDYSFDGPDTLPAGLTTLRIENTGNELHQIQLLKLTDGKRLADLAAALEATANEMPRWAKHMGGPNGISAGSTADARIHLEPGSYVLTCMIPSSDGRPHVALGMSKEVRVIDIDNAPASHGQLSQYHLAMRDYEFVLVEPLTRGTHSFYVKNRGTEPHQVSLVRLEPGASSHDIVAFFSNKTAPLPGELIGGMTALEPDGEGAFTATLNEGHYAFICLFPNPAAPSSHAARGMVMDFTVD